jgi:hypothetical protein
MEIFAWVSFALFARVVAVWMFVVCRTAQMWVLAGEKKRELVQQYPMAERLGRLTPFF